MNTPIQHYCLNCHHPVEFNYCPNCGQPIRVPKIDTKFIKQELQHGIFHFDNAFVSTLIQLYQQPGVVIKNFIKGKRKPYASPFTLFVFLATIYTLLSVHYSPKEAFKMQINGNVSTIVSYLVNHYTWFVLFALPIVSLITFVLFKKNNYNYYEIVVYECFIQSKIIVVHFLFLFVTHYFPNGTLFKIIPVVLIAIISIRAKLLFFDQYKRSEIVLRSLACIVLNWAAIIFFLFLLALAITGVNELMGLGI